MLPLPSSAATRVDRSADQQVISINPGRYQNKANSNVEIIPAQPHLLQIRTNRKKIIITALSLSQLDAVSLREALLFCFERLKEEECKLEGEEEDGGDRGWRKGERAAVCVGY